MTYLAGHETFGMDEVGFYREALIYSQISDMICLTLCKRRKEHTICRFRLISAALIRAISAGLEDFRTRGPHPRQKAPQTPQGHRQRLHQDPDQPGSNPGFRSGLFLCGTAGAELPCGGVLRIRIFNLRGILYLRGCDLRLSGEGIKGYVGFVKKQCVIPFLAFIALIAAIAIGAVTSWVVLRAGSYSELLSIETGDFASEVDEISYDQIPMLDEDSAARLGNRKLGELADMVSQFEILPSYTQINYQGRPVRVTSLAYGDIVKWFTNRSEGLPAYLVIDMVTQEAEVVRLKEE